MPTCKRSTSPLSTSPEIQFDRATARKRNGQDVLRDASGERQTARHGAVRVASVHVHWPCRAQKKVSWAFIAGGSRLDSFFQLRHFVLRATCRAGNAFALYLQTSIFQKANMFKFSRLTSSALIVSAIALSGCGMMPMSSNPVTRLSGANEVPATVSTGSGTLEATLDNQTNVLSWTVMYSGLSGPATAGHFHGPAMAGQNAGVALPFSGSVESPIKGTATLTAAQAADVRAGKWYVNLHTKANPGGEIRAQLNLKQ